MGTSDSKYNTSSFDENSVRKNDIQPPTRYKPPFRKFGQLYRKINGIKALYKLNVLEPYTEDLQVESEIYKDLQGAFTNKTEQIEVQKNIDDEENTERWIFQVTNNNKKQSLLIRPYQNDDSHTYANILCEVHYAELAAKIASPNLHKLIESYSIYTGIKQIEEPNSQIFVMERIDANLSQIITFRRQGKWDWSERQFLKLTIDLVNGLSALHEAGISHNDIRPANVYFSLLKNCYILGSYSSCCKNQGNKSSSKIKLNSNFNAPEASHKSEIDLLQGDVYSLGYTLLCAFYLTQPLDRKLVIKQNQIYSSKYDILKLIDAMIAPEDHRATIAEIKAKLPSSSYEFTEMNKLIQSMAHRSRPTIQQKSASKLAASWAYQRLGLWNEWRKQYKQSFQLIQTNLDKQRKADALQQLALIDHCRGDYEISCNNAKLAATMYRNLGQNQIDQGIFGKAESYYKKAIACSNYYQLENDVDLAWSLQGLSRVHSEKNQYQRAKILAAAAANTIPIAARKDSLEYCKLRVKQARLQTQFGDFDSADKILQEALVIARKKQSVNSKSSLIVGDVLAQLGFNFMKKASHFENPQKEEILNNSQKNLSEAVKIFEAIDQDNHYSIALAIKTFGEVSFKKLDYAKAKQDFTKSLELIDRYGELYPDFKNTRIKGDILCLRGISKSYEGLQSEAIQDFDAALKVFRQLYGSDHNRWSALAIGNLGRVYANAKQKLKAQDCIKICLNILQSVAGKEDADYKHFKLVEQNLDDLI